MGKKLIEKNAPLSDKKKIILNLLNQKFKITLLKAISVIACPVKVGKTKTFGGRIGTDMQKWY